MQNIYISRRHEIRIGAAEKMEKTKASFEIETPLWRMFLKIAKFEKNSSGSALLRGFIKQIVGEKA
jgi:hypothetical protein